MNENKDLARAFRTTIPSKIDVQSEVAENKPRNCLLYTSPSPRD